MLWKKKPVDMANDEYIYESFREKFSAAEYLPPASVWENIEAVLDKKRDDKILFYKKIAAGLAFLLTVGSVLFYYQEKQVPDTENQKAIVISDTLKQNKFVKPQKEKYIDREKEKEEEVAYVPDYVVKRQVANRSFVVETSSKHSEITESVIGLSASDTNSIDTYYKLTYRKIPEYKEKGKLRLSSFKMIQYQAMVAAMQPEEKDEKSFRKEGWEVGARIAPLFTYRDVEKSDKDMFGNSGEDYNSSEAGMLALGAGLNLHYKISDRFLLQSGIGYSVMGQTIRDVRVVQSVSNNAMNYDYKGANTFNEKAVANSMGGIRLKDESVSMSSGGADSPELFHANVEEAEAIVSDEEVDLMQRLEYIEVPLLMRYKLKENERFQFQVLGGFSSNFLIGNSVYMIEDDNFRKNVGKTEHVKEISYSGTIGMAFQIFLVEKLFLNIEPAFKYYLTPLNNSSYVETHPYSIGLYTGVTYAF